MKKKNETRYEIKGIIIKRKKNCGKNTLYIMIPPKENVNESDMNHDIRSFSAIVSYPRMDSCISHKSERPQNDYPKTVNNRVTYIKVWRSNN